ncbi:MAG: hypothetical protein P4L95_21410 [Rouxiella aceris]|uniref:hypothetical protein n=1 Tax=Rouxiella aceris TaxID=2703884 RepID=UPI0028521849|nr:hypothetical protein [Rouxiella aceris]MDR3434423.1 hypothetical protein [Rouxiella aceris]
MSLSPPSTSNQNIFFLSANNKHAAPQKNEQTGTPAAVGQSTDNTWTDTVSPHFLTRQADGRLHFTHVDNIALSAYALQSGERESRAVQDRPLGNNQLESVFNVSSKKTDPVTGHQVQSTRRYLVQWHEFPIQETWEKALTQPGYPPLKVVANPQEGGWTIEANDFLRTMAQNIYFYRGGPEAAPVDKATGLRRQGELIWVDINGRLFPVAEQKKTVHITPPASRSSLGTATGGQQKPLSQQVSEYFIKTPADKNIIDWPPLPVVRDRASGKWTPVLSPAHINSLLGLLGNAGLYGISHYAAPLQQSLPPGYTQLQVGNNTLRVASNITVTLPGVSLPAAIHHRGRLPPVPLAWDNLHKRYYILSDPQPFTRPTYTERETWGIRLLVLGIMIRDPIHASVELIKATLGDAAAQQRLGQLIHTGVSDQDNSTGGKFARGADNAFSTVFFNQSPKGAVATEVVSWITTAIGKALLNQELTAEEMLGSYQSLQNLRYTVETPVQGQGQIAEKKQSIPGVGWLESKVVDAPALQQDWRYRNLWRHPDGKIYLKERDRQLQYLPLIEENSQTFRELRPADKGEGRHFTKGTDGKLREMMPNELQAYRAEQPTAQELSQRNMQAITFSHRDGSLGRGYVEPGNNAVKGLYLFDPATRSFRFSGKSVDANKRVIGLAGGMNPNERTSPQPGSSQQIEPTAIKSAADSYPPILNKALNHAELQEFYNMHHERDIIYARGRDALIESPRLRKAFDILKNLAKQADSFTDSDFREIAKKHFGKHNISAKTEVIKNIANNVWENFHKYYPGGEYEKLMALVDFNAAESLAAAANIGGKNLAQPLLAFSKTDFATERALPNLTALETVLHEFTHMGQVTAITPNGVQRNFATHDFWYDNASQRNLPEYREVYYSNDAETISTTISEYIDIMTEQNISAQLGEEEFRKNILRTYKKIKHDPDELAFFQEGLRSALTALHIPMDWDQPFDRILESIIVDPEKRSAIAIFNAETVTQALADLYKDKLQAFFPAEEQNLPEPASDIERAPATDSDDNDSLSDRESSD